MANEKKLTRVELAEFNGQKGKDSSSPWWASLSSGRA